MFSGSIVAIVTPMKAKGEIDYKRFENLLNWHLQEGTDGIVVLGTTGESPTIDIDERDKLIKLAVKVIRERVPLIIGTGANCTQHTMELTSHAMELGADAGLLVTPYYNKPTQEGLYQHFKAVAEAVPMPLILYNVPSRTGCDLLPATVGRLVKLPNIVAVKEATGDINRLHQLLELNAEFDLLSGDDGTALEFMLQGGRGVISVAANVVPREFRELCQSALHGDLAKAKTMNDRLKPLYKQIFIESNPIPTKWILSQMGLIEAGIRLPLTPLAPQYHEAVRGVMKDLMVQA